MKTFSNSQLEPFTVRQVKDSTHAKATQLPIQGVTHVHRVLHSVNSQHRAAALRLQHAHRDQHLRLLGRSLPDEELGGLEQAADLQQQRGLRQRPGAAAAGQPERQERDGGTHQCELIMINDEALVQTKSLSTQLSLTTKEEPRLPCDRGNTGNVVCNTSFTNLSDSRVKTEMVKADVAELKQLFDSVEAKQYKRPDMNEDLRLRLGRLRRNEVEEPDGHREVEQRHGDGHP